MESNFNESHLAKCLQRLKEWGAPLEDWRCVGLINMCEGDDPDDPPSFATCELCDCCKVRYVHVMDHPLYFEEVRVGCICAGIMESDELAAKERERLMRNRSKRRNNYLKKQWIEKEGGCYQKQFCLIYKDQLLEIKVNSRNMHFVSCNGGQPVCSYKGRPIDNFYSAIYAAFDLADPMEDIL